MILAGKGPVNRSGRETEDGLCIVAIFWGAVNWTKAIERAAAASQTLCSHAVAPPHAGNSSFKRVAASASTGGLRRKARRTSGFVKIQKGQSGLILADKRK